MERVEREALPTAQKPSERVDVTAGAVIEETKPTQDLNNTIYLGCRLIVWNTSGPFFAGRCWPFMSKSCDRTMKVRAILLTWSCSISIRRLQIGQYDPVESGFNHVPSKE
jgi:hypothetical protein